ncbi:GTPase [Alkalinema sp. FACHB-956]|uniref:GTPase family protein n=1 Tax=Alkalinema sp. FACHB-956 TaxID=2692768 RepID=UPI001688B7A1|nr:GTPase [Alkalinema sp. FACHB-956]MBD2329544.1 50S ribosome-binding GTPase [Alkalinema sp. FACHB-956]
MVRLQTWQWGVLAAPIALVLTFLLIAAGLQIHAWGLSWIWAVIGLLFVGWRWLLVKWTQPALTQVEAAIAELSSQLPPVDDSAPAPAMGGSLDSQADAELRRILDESRSDPPVWQDWNLFWQRCLSLISAIAHLYAPQAKQPLLNIYVPQAYALLRGTVDDLDQWMQKLSPVLNQLTIGQAYEAYEIYQKLAPSARRVWQLWQWAQWILNPVTAAARTLTQGTNNRATQELIGNLGQLLREATLRNLAQQAIALYSGQPATALPDTPQPALPKAETRTLKEILAQASPPETVAQQPVNLLLVGRTGAGKSSLINTLFVEPQAEVDALPSTDRIRDYRWQAPTGETLTLWDTPGYEQVQRSDLRDQVLEHAQDCDGLLLVTPALDPALQMDLEFLQDLQAVAPDLPLLGVVTQVDRLRPLREWQPSYDWRTGTQPKEIAIREAIAYRRETLPLLQDIFPLVTQSTDRPAWGLADLSQAIIQVLDPAKQLRLARFLNDLDSRSLAAAKIIDQYSFQMTTTQGLTAFLKSPVLNFLSTLATGSPALAILLAEKIPVEQLPLVIGKLQMAYELYTLLADRPKAPPGPAFDLLTLWPVLTNPAGTADRNAWAFGHTVVEYWTGGLPGEKLADRFTQFLDRGLVIPMG